jgi:DNA-directed RNA polymerase specialized sigma24 family protein
MRSRSREAREAAYAEFVAARQDRLRRLAFALCGDWDRADEILGAALTKLYVAWPRLEREGIEEAFVRRHIVRADLDGSAAGTDALTEGGPLAQALLALPVKQRKAVLLRHWLGLPVEEIAEELAISRSAAQSQAERGLAALTESLAREPR